MLSINKQTTIQGLGSIQNSYFKLFLSSLFVMFHNAALRQMSYIVGGRWVIFAPGYQ